MTEQQIQKLNELQENVIQWAENKGILTNGTIYAQSLKTSEEVIETLQAINKNDTPETIDGLGDVIVTLIILHKMVSKNDNLNMNVDIEVKFKYYPLEFAIKQIIHTNSNLLLCVINTTYKNNFSESKFRIKSQVAELLKQVYILCDKLNLQPEYCLETAYNVIAKRQGKMIGGTFVKN